MNIDESGIIRAVAASARIRASSEMLLLGRPFTGMKELGLDDVEIGLLLCALRDQFPNALIDDRFGEHDDASIAELIHVCEAQMSWSRQ